MCDKKIIIIGAGLGGLMCGAILAKEGCEVTLVEKNPRVGGCLQCYSRKGSVFDTGMHLFGGMRAGGNMRRICDYLGITPELEIRELDAVSDIEVFIGATRQLYPFSMSRSSFVKSLAEMFPQAKENLEQYLKSVDGVMEQMDLFHLRKARWHDMAEAPDFMLPASGFVSRHVKDARLQALLSAINVLYAGEAGTTPTFLHAAISTMFLNGACRIAGGYEALARVLVSVIEANGGTVFVNSRVTKIVTCDGCAVGVETHDGERYSGDVIILASPPTALENLIDDVSLIPNGYRAFLNSKRDSLSAFIVNMRLRQDAVRFSDRIGFYTDDCDTVWTTGCGPDVTRFMYMTPPLVNQGEFAETLCVVAPMDWRCVERWAGTVTGARGREYALFKDGVVRSIVSKLSLVYPGLEQAIEFVDSATPLTIRDFTGVRHGAMCGLRQDCNDVMPFVPLRTKIQNLLLTGQSVNMHGFCGVTLTAVQTCEAILGKDYLIDKLN